MLLFLDDIRMPEQMQIIVQSRDFNVSEANEIVIVRSYYEFAEWIEKNGLPDMISFDHDLADVRYNPQTTQEIFVYHEKTGYDCAKWLVNHCLDKSLTLPKWAIHSANPVGIENIKSLFTNFEKHNPNTYRHE